MRQKLVSVRKAFTLGGATVLTLPKGFVKSGSFVKIYRDDGRLILEPLKEVV